MASAWDIKVLKRDLNRCKRELPLNHPLLAIMYCRVAVAEIVGDRPDSALKSLLYAEEVLSDPLYPSDEMRVSALRSVSEAYFRLNLIMDAMEYAEKAARESVSVFPEGHMEITISHAWIGDICCGWGDYSNSLKHYQKAKDSLNETTSGGGELSEWLESRIAEVQKRRGMSRLDY